MTERKLAELTGNILGEIKKSLKVFKPSKSLSMLTKLAEEEQKTHAAEIDLVISGGGMKGYFMTGCYDILAYELKRRNIKIARVAGASAGAWSGFLICTGMTTDFWIETYYEFKRLTGSTIHEAYSEMVCILCGNMFIDLNSGLNGWKRLFPRMPT